MIFRLFVTILVLLPSFFCMGQIPDNRILLTIDGHKIEAGEFTRMYKKNLDPGKTLNADDYLKQFIVFKLKVADAIREGYDTTRAFRTEFNGYRSQLAQNYLTDTQVKERLLKSAYQRSLTEINAWHILVSLSPNAQPEDTLKAWRKATAIRERIISGEPFEQVARSSSDDKSVLTNGGNLGYFTVFQMIMPFEDAVYALKQGEISAPVRTPYGYHIIRVTNNRPSRGRIKVAHIMKVAPPGIPDAEAKNAGLQIDSIYNLLKNGGNFRELAQKLSDHKESAASGGELQWFGTGEIISDFSEAAFSLKDTGAYTKPVRTLYGWHIIKLLDKQPIKSYEESKSYLESRINQSYLNSVSKRSFVSKLKKLYNFSINPEMYDWFIMNTDTLIIQGRRKYDRSTIPQGNIFTFANQKTSGNEFAGYIEKRGYIIETKDSVDFIKRTIETKAADQLIAYEDSGLEQKNPEFRYLMNEFHDGILLFEISGKKVWNRVNEDTTGLLKYYEEHKDEYLTKPGISGKIYLLRVNDGARTLESAYKKYSSKRDCDALLNKKFNRKNDSILVIKEGKWFSGQDKVIDDLKRAKGTQLITYKGYPAIINITEIIEPAPLPFSNVQGEMMQGWQDSLESSWIEDLKKNYKISIDNNVLREVKKTLGQ
ncbi:MAG TPA: peptidylprolyl isomerase [Bacteroidales bacterium]|nr:peptidylprolyl isomerase [Bacteroidales bacterium]